MNCPFYARALHQVLLGEWVILENPRSNQCALVTRAHSPCIMEIAGHAPSWELCQRNPMPLTADTPEQEGSSGL